MTRVACWGSLPILICVLVGNGVAGDAVYRVVEPDGSVRYTDLAPTVDARPVELGQISIIERPASKSEIPAEARREGDADPEDADLASTPNLNQLRRRYADFRVVRPVPDFTFRVANNPVTLAWDASQPLAGGMAVVFRVDGRAAPATRDTVIAVPGLGQGWHEVSAELQAPGGRRVLRTDPVPFQVHVLYNWIEVPGIRVR